MDCSLPGSSVHGILRARILEWVAVPGGLPPGDRPHPGTDSLSSELPGKSRRGWPQAHFPEAWLGLELVPPRNTVPACSVSPRGPCAVGSCPLNARSGLGPSPSLGEWFTDGNLLGRWPKPALASALCVCHRGSEAKTKAAPGLRICLSSLKEQQAP